MTPREYWNTYVERNGGPAKVSELTGVPLSTIAGVCNGSRGIGRRLAQRLAAADPMLDYKTLVWVTAKEAA
ncbi:hypothetical protein [Arenimonas sp.]|uniref:hypothetical protein n=1 Tax=Arenimonas sp. TaxID=1872635 RepID=UPI0039E59DB2